MIIEMAAYKTILSSLVVIAFCLQGTLSAKIFQYTVEPLLPTGFRIYVPQESGISFVEFKIKINEPFYDSEDGTINVAMTYPINGRWIYEDNSTKLYLGDVVYFSGTVKYKGQSIATYNHQHTVTGFLDPEGNQVEGLQLNYPISVGLCKRSATRVYIERDRYSKPCVGEILLNEDFRNVKQFNTSSWTIAKRFSNAPDHEFVVYRKENILVGNGLKIIPKFMLEDHDDDFIRTGTLVIDPCTGLPGTSDCQRRGQSFNILPSVSSGRLDTSQFLNFIYGRVEVRAKLPRGDWIYPLILLESAQYSNIQVRIASSVGNPNLTTPDGNDISGHVLWGGAVGSEYQQPQEDRINPSRTTKYNDDLWSNDFHVYEMIWSPKKIVLMVDGEQYDEKRVELPDDSPYFLTLGVAVGGVAEFPDYSLSKDYVKPWRNVAAKALFTFYNTTSGWAKKSWSVGYTTLEVDYVRVYAL